MSGMRNTLHATLADGGYRYEYEDGLGNRCTAIKQTRRAVERQFWTHDLLPEREFADFKAMKAALDATMPDALIWEADKYPRLEPIKRDECGNRCRLCPIDPAHRLGHKYETWRVEVATNWQHSWYASLCDAHREEFDGKPRELLAALKAEVAERNARTGAFRAQLTAEGRESA